MFRRIWLTMPFQKKVRSFGLAVWIILLLAASFGLFAMQSSLRGFGSILDDNKTCQSFMDSMNAESASFRRYITERSDENLQDYTSAAQSTAAAVEALPFEYQKIGQERYARTWNVRNAYQQYALQRDSVLKEQERSGADYIREVYEVYSMQEYLDQYGRRLLESTVEAGSTVYSAKLQIFQLLPFLFINLTFFFLFLVYSMSRAMTDSIVRPVLALSECARAIAENDFERPDLDVENQDELGELVDIFNQMKHSTKNYINTLRENFRMNELLQKEQLENSEMEKRLEQNRLELLKSQINPHFLFNTLNMVASMASLEDAEVTEKMIHSLASLFRYNLSTREQEVPLENELTVAEHYMYLQQMRFGSRVRYSVEQEEGTEGLIIPSFTLQPLVENAIVHGIVGKEEGGSVQVSIRREGIFAILRIQDDGAGMDEETLEQLRETLKNRQTSRGGIGLGNIYRRIHSLYPEGDLEISSEKGRGTCITLRIPQRER